MSKQSTQKNKKQLNVRESEDDFDKLIGHIEGSRIEKPGKVKKDYNDNSK